ncbi:MAG: acetyl-CoA C-acyltransferase [Bacteroidia bacterium]|nr:acetyl-CoA C-acyltransferase [Bacteroidia bacterium]
MQEAYIVTGLRSAVGKANRGGFRNYRPDDLAADVIKALIASVPALDPERVDDLIVGCAVPEAEQGMQMGRWISLLSLPQSVSGVIVNRYCGSGLETVAMGVAKIKAGMADCIIAGGTESMSMVPIMGHKTSLNYNIASEHPEWYLGMGLTAEEVAVDYKVSREDMDAFSFHSHQKAINAIEKGYFDGQIVPVEVEDVLVSASGQRISKKTIIKTDEGPRADTSIEALGRLRPVFRNNGTVTAGNSSQTSDGAAFVLILSERMMKELGLEPRLRMVGYATEGIDPRIMGMGPIKAVPKVLKQTGMKSSDIDVIELNEAFASQSLAVIRELELDPAKVNPNGGAIALGHPLGCTGAKLTVQVMNELERTSKKYAMVTACVGGGQGVAGIFESMR